MLLILAHVKRTSARKDPGIEGLEKLPPTEEPLPVDKGELASPLQHNHVPEAAEA
jgi:hypothetical protein